MSNPTAPNPDDVRAYYDEFLRSRMLSYRLTENDRIEAAIARVLPLLRVTDRVLDVGCGIGIVAERLASQVPSGQVLGIDISPQNIWYAKRTTRRKNLSFAALDAVKEIDAIHEILGGPANVVVLVDVIEHIPDGERPQFLSRLRAVSSDSALLVLTYPSPQYQRYLRENNPDELQVIDNIIALPTLVEEAAAAGYHLLHYSLEDIWLSNQYCHVILHTDNSLNRQSQSSSPDRNLFIRVVEKAKSVILSRLIRRYRRWKYVDNIFGSSRLP